VLPAVSEFPTTHPLLSIAVAWLVRAKDPQVQEGTLAIEKSIIGVWIRKREVQFRRCVHRSDHVSSVVDAKGTAAKSPVSPKVGYQPAAKENRMKWSWDAARRWKG
jgi:hypothetical protein